MWILHFTSQENWKQQFQSQLEYSSPNAITFVQKHKSNRNKILRFYGFSRRHFKSEPEQQQSKKNSLNLKTKHVKPKTPPKKHSTEQKSYPTQWQSALQETAAGHKKRGGLSNRRFLAGFCVGFEECVFWSSFDWRCLEFENGFKNVIWNYLMC
jgi:hypothetical protein